MIRYANIDDMKRVNELRKMVNELHVEGRPDIFRGGFGDELADLYRFFLEDERYDVIVATHQGEILGFAVVQYVERPESAYNKSRCYLHIDEFGVDEAYRRKTVATQIMDFIKSEAKAKGFGKIELDCWSFNEGAMKFYEAVGFEQFRVYMQLDI